MSLRINQASPLHYKVKNKNEKQTNLWIPPSQLNIYILTSLHSGIIAYFRKKNPGKHQW